MKLKEIFSRASSDSDKFFLFLIMLLASVVIFLLYLFFSWLANLSNPAALKSLFSWDYIYAFLLWLEIIPLAVLKPALINYLIVISISLILIGYALYLLPLKYAKYAFGCYIFQITENATSGATQQTCITTQAANNGINIAIGGYYTLITVVGALFIETIRDNNNV